MLILNAPSKGAERTFHDYQSHFQPEPIRTRHRPQQQPSADEEAFQAAGRNQPSGRHRPGNRSKLYERAVDAVFAAEENAFDKAAEMQAAITTDELITHDD